MSKHNYSQYSNKPKNEFHKQSKIEAAAIHEPVAAPEVKMEYVEPVTSIKPEVALVQETVETVTLPETVAGVAANCARLNVRATPSLDAEILCVLDAGAEVHVDVANSNDEWFKLCTATGIEGYSMRNFIKTHL